MADEVELHFSDPRPPEAVHGEWRSAPPHALRSFDVVDESYNSITWEARFYDWPQKLMIVCSLGLLLLFRNLIPMHSVWRLTTRFDADGADRRRTTVTILGKASEEARTALGELAAEHGGTVGLRVGA